MGEQGVFYPTSPKMMFTYVGIDSHKETHTAIFLNCFFEKLGAIAFGNLPADFENFLVEAQKYQQNGTTFLFGLEDTTKYGRALATYLLYKGHAVKHTNAFLVAGERKNLGLEKSDHVDAECAARILISKYETLPNAARNADEYHILRSLVVRRSFLVNNNKMLKMYLHSLLMLDFPNYHTFFSDLRVKSAMAFFEKWPSANLLQGVSAEELGAFLELHSGGLLGITRATQILKSTDTSVPTHEIRNKTVLSALRQLKYNQQSIEEVETDLAYVFHQFNTTLTSMTGLSVAGAAQLLSCIGDIRNFATPAKLARYAGIAPVSHSSGKRDMQFASQRGDRELNSCFYNLAVRLSFVHGTTHKVMNPFFYDYYHRKVAEGKTKRQALKCVQRRLVNIIWTMLTHQEAYVNPPMYALPEDEDEGIN